jgi:hypothetical protein
LYGVIEQLPPQLVGRKIPPLFVVESEFALALIKTDLAFVNDLVRRITEDGCAVAHGPHHAAWRCHPLVVDRAPRSRRGAGVQDYPHQQKKAVQLLFGVRSGTVGRHPRRAGIRAGPASETLPESGRPDGGDLPVPAQGASTHARVSNHVRPSRGSRSRTRPCCFHDHYRVGTRDSAFAAQWLSYALPYCFAPTLTDDDARLGVDAGRYSFIATDLHRLLLASLPAHSDIRRRLRTQQPCWLAR